MITSLQQKYAMVDEVNEVLTNNYVLKREFDKLKEENENLKTTIAALKQTIYCWEFYFEGFTETVEFIGYQYVSKTIKWCKKR